MEEKIVWKAIGRNPFAKVVITNSENKILAKGETVEEALAKIEEDK